jgi:hypothetical protein
MSLNGYLIIHTTILVGYVLYSLHVCVWVCQIRQLHLTIPPTSALSCASGAFLGGSQGGAGMPPPGYVQCSATSGSPGQCPELFFWAVFAIFRGFVN